MSELIQESTQDLVIDKSVISRGAQSIMKMNGFTSGADVAYFEKNVFFPKVKSTELEFVKKTFYSIVTAYNLNPVLREIYIINAGGKDEIFIAKEGWSKILAELYDEVEVKYEYSDEEVEIEKQFPEKVWVDSKVAGGKGRYQKTGLFIPKKFKGYKWIKCCIKVTKDGKTSYSESPRRHLEGCALDTPNWLNDAHYMLSVRAYVAAAKPLSKNLGGIVTEQESSSIIDGEIEEVNPILTFEKGIEKILMSTDIEDLKKNYDEVATELMLMGYDKTPLQEAFVKRNQELKNG